MLKRINLDTFKKYVRSNSVGGIILIGCVLLSLIIANVPAGRAFESWLQTYIGWENSSIGLRFPILHWINDGLMAIFFLLVGLEIKREMVEGELSSPQKALLPVIAAFGGAVLPAVIFAVLNKGTHTAPGWGIPMATDIAFALAAITLLGKKVPGSLKIFLAALAIVDDLIAILVIALFYSSEIHLNYLLYAGAVMILLIVFNRLKFKRLMWYLVPGVLVWYFVHHSGIHATIAGVLVAMTLPTTPGAEQSPLEKLEHALTKPVNFFIIPLFALANTNIRFEASMLSGLAGPLGLGIIIGLIAGKCAGIFFSTWIGVQLKIGKLPRQAGWLHMIGLGLLAGIGFTMSIFISLLSFDDPLMVAEAKLAILVASVLAAILGCITLISINRKKERGR
ncbi:sodium/proton antiporter, NhaA family (TC 2.A.33.1.1) [Niabella drilacis]|uniref:Na(+)/H(+) antiporter NhaA n=2 Tax=Niabella drilacis (strain DSM 25811 / CCM 8410 / CCUG 62505 / LMG 26954 / E90) TaxID=1285928 RepID=A0A1G6T041_NIADE|nr:sodium/proton antiporter, NhaA family (TC 2.A.33.1.1) [Niabella drilacis]